MRLRQPPYHIVLVDDMPAVRESLRWALEDAGDLVVVGELGEGHLALEHVSAVRPDVVIMDIELPDMDGVEVARQLKALPNPPIVIFLTVHGDNGCRERALAAGGDAFVAKGHGWPTLIAEVRQHLNG